MSQGLFLKISEEFGYFLSLYHLKHVKTTFFVGLNLLNNEQIDKKNTEYDIKSLLRQSFPKQKNTSVLFRC